MGKIVCALAVLLALVGSTFATTAAFAGTTSTLAGSEAAGIGGQVDIVTPVDGARLEDWDGTWSVDFTDAPAGQYRWRISYYGGSHTGDGGGYYDSTVGVYEFKTWSAPAHTDVTLEIWLAADPTVKDTHTFYVSGYHSPALVGIEDGATLVDWNGYVTVDFSGARPGTWDLGVYRDADNTLPFVQVTYDGTSATLRQRVRLDEFPMSTYYSVYFRQNGQSFGDYSFHNEAGLRLRDLAASPSTFYPTVRDGYRDSVRLTWSASLPATSVVTVRDSANRVVWRTSVSRSAAGTSSAVWNGRSSSGAKVPVGTYKLAVTGTGDNGSKDVLNGSVKVASDTVTDTRTLTRSGTGTSKRLRSGDCYFRSYYAELSIDCVGFSGRATAQARYSFSLPSSATHLRWRVNGSLRCCAEGVFERGLVRTSRTAAYVFVRLSGLRAYDVRGVRLTYDYQRRR